jgi:putative hydroxymethylpyrimidine transport system substrate-binding protein
MAPQGRLSRRAALALLAALGLGCGRALRAQPAATPTTPADDPAVPTATPRPPDPSPTPIPRPSAIGRVTPPPSPTPLGGRGARLSLALDGVPWAAQAGVFLAEERGYFAEVGLDVHLRVAESREAALGALAAGTDDLALVGGLDLLRARGEGTPIVSLFAVTPHPLVALLSLRAGGPARPRDLDGRRVAMPADRFGRAVVEAILRADGLEPARLADTAAVADPVGALVARRIDAFGGYAPREGAALEARGAPPNVFAPDRFGVPDYYELVIATTDSVRAARGEQLRALVGALVRGYTDAARAPNEALDALVRANPALDRDIGGRTLGALAGAWRASPIGEQADPVWRSSFLWAARQGLVNPSLDPATAFTNDALPRPTPGPSGTATPASSGATPTPVRRPGAPGPPAPIGQRQPTTIRIGP